MTGEKSFGTHLPTGVNHQVQCIYIMNIYIYSKPKNIATTKTIRTKMRNTRLFSNWIWYDLTYVYLAGGVYNQLMLVRPLYNLCSSDHGLKFGPQISSSDHQTPSNWVCSASENQHIYPLVNVYKVYITMEHHHFQWVIPLSTINGHFQ